MSHDHDPAPHATPPIRPNRVRPPDALGLTPDAILTWWRDRASAWSTAPLPRPGRRTPPEG